MKNKPSQIQKDPNEKEQEEKFIVYTEHGNLEKINIKTEPVNHENTAARREKHADKSVCPGPRKTLGGSPAGDDL